MPGLIIFFTLCVAFGVLVAIPLAAITRDD